MASPKLTMSKMKDTERTSIVDYLVSNQEFIKEKCKYFNELNEALHNSVNKHMHVDIEEQYNDEVKSYICEIVAMHSNHDAESIMIVLEDMDLKDYFKALEG